MTPIKFEDLPEVPPEELLDESHKSVELPCSPAPPAEIKLFIARIPKTYEERDLRKLFEEFGPVKEVVVIRDKETNIHKNCAFVRMASICQADAAIRSLNNQCVVDTSLGAIQIRYATGENERLGFTSLVGDPGVDEAKLFVGSLPRTMTEKELTDMFKDYGNTIDVFVMKDLNSGGTKGCGFVRMKYKEQALYAIQMLNGKKTLEGCTRPLEVRFAQNKNTIILHEQLSYNKMRRNPIPPLPSHNPNFHQNYNTNYNLNYNNLGYSNNMNYNNNNNNQYNNNNRNKKINSGEKFGGYINYNNGNPRQVGPWKEYISPDGRFYYYNIDNGSTQWEVPREFLLLNSGTLTQHFQPTHNNFNFNNNNNLNQPDDSSLFVFHIPNQWTNADLYRTFSAFGKILNARIIFDRNTNRSKGYAFVSYDNPESATLAVANMNGFSILGKKLKVNYKSHRPTPY